MKKKKPKTFLSIPERQHGIDKCATSIQEFSLAPAKVTKFSNGAVTLTSEKKKGLHKQYLTANK